MSFIRQTTPFFIFGILATPALYVGCTAEVRDFGYAGGAGGAGGQSSTAESSSAASSGDPASCSSDADCPTLTLCATPYCDMTAGACASTPAPDGPVPGKVDLPNDCIEFTCVGGVEMAVGDDSEVPDAPNPCATPYCSGGFIGMMNVAAGMACASPAAAGICDGNGACVGCLADGIQNGFETDVDCGGSGQGCSPCPNGKGCLDSTDCNSMNCCTACSQTCVPPGFVCDPC